MCSRCDSMSSQNGTPWQGRKREKKIIRDYGQLVCSSTLLSTDSCGNEVCSQIIVAELPIDLSSALHVPTQPLLLGFLSWEHFPVLPMRGRMGPRPDFGTLANYRRT